MVCNVCGEDIGSHAIGHVLYVHKDVVERDIRSGDMPDLYRYVSNRIPDETNEDDEVI